MNILLIFFSCLGWTLSTVNFGVSLSLKYNLEELHLPISKIAFMKSQAIYSSQIPYLELIAFFIFGALGIFRFIEYREIMRKQDQGFYDQEQLYLLRLKLRQSLEWSNIVVTQSFIFTTLGIALIIACIFSSFGYNEAEFTLDKYHRYPKLSDEDHATLDDFESESKKYIVILIFNILSLISLVGQFMTVLYNKYKAYK